MSVEPKRWVNFAMIGFFVLILVGYGMWEWSGRFMQPFSYQTERFIVKGGQPFRYIEILQRSETAVDTSRRTFEDPRKGKTNVRAWLKDGGDTVSFETKGFYYSEFRPIRFNRDSNWQLLLVPNTEHGLPTAIGEILYLDTLGHLRLKHLEATHISDADEDGVFELYRPQAESFYHLNVASGEWEKAEVIPKVETRRQKL